MLCRLIDLIESAGCADDLMLIMADLCVLLGFQYFALTHHGDLGQAASPVIRLHNYPARWAEFYDVNKFGVSDPVHRASHMTSVGFRWSRMADMIALTPGDRRILGLGIEQGIGDGVTVPANVPGEARGSCSFVNESGKAIPEAILPIAQLVGTFAFERARLILSIRTPLGTERKPVLTDRQRDCILWAARGKSDWETGRLLHLSEETVALHIKQGCERYGVNKRTSLVIRALFDGTLTFTDILRR